jgi:hypothetical protein
MKRLTLTTSLCLLLSAGIGFAEQKIEIHADKTAHFWAAAGGVTRLSVEGDRIRKLIHDDSAFETMNDEETGDVFMRYVGDQAKLLPETGHIITESGATIAYEIKPKISAEAETVVIAIKGGVTKAATSDGAGADDQAAPDFLDDAAISAGGGGYSDGLVAFARKVIVKHIGRKAPPKAGAGAVVASERSGGFKAKVMVASGGSAGALIRPQTYYTPKTLAVWVDKTSLAPGERSWVLVVEASK